MTIKVNSWIFFAEHKVFYTNLCIALTNLELHLLQQLHAMMPASRLRRACHCFSRTRHHVDNSSYPASAASTNMYNILHSLCYACYRL